MNNFTRNLLIISAIVTSFFGAYAFYLAKQDYAADSVIFNTSKNIAINGYDTVSYQLEERSRRGESTYQAEWAGSIWYFSSLKNRDLFAADPERYAPQFGGYDPVGISEGYTTPSDPEVYTVKAGQLFLHYSEAYRDHWETDRGTNLILANSNWAFLRAQLLEKQNN
jgi:YHS domain-containing protein|tara:strand:+ start:293629 stop:294129 length:501 start_codon:yes stop_codon:yes gene_type:complete